MLNAGFSRMPTGIGSFSGEVFVTNSVFYNTCGKCVLSYLKIRQVVVIVHSVHSFLRIKRLHNRRDLPKEPVLRRLVRDINPLVVFFSGLMSESNPCLFRRHTLHVREWKVPFQRQPSRPEGNNSGSSQKHDIVSSRDVSICPLIS